MLVTEHLNRFRGGNVWPTAGITGAGVPLARHYLEDDPLRSSFSQVEYSVSAERKRPERRKVARASVMNGAYGYIVDEATATIPPRPP
jgi:hypothetical protein